MKLKRLLIVIVLVCCAGVAWKARHRVRQYFAQQEEVQARNDLVVEFQEDVADRSAPALRLNDTDWPWWRGRHHDNHVRGSSIPLTWGETENVRWKTAIPGRGHSSPCVVGNRIFLTTADDDEKTQNVLCIAADTGKIVWDRQVHHGTFIYANEKNSHASSTTATDGHSVFAVFASDNSIWLSALSLNGEVLWQKNLGPYASKEGFGASPLIVDNFVIVAADSIERSWMAAVHRSSGDIAWRIARGPGTSYASPILLEQNGETQILLAGLNAIRTYRPRDGSLVWETAGPDLTASTPVVGDGMVFVTGCTADSGIFGVNLQKTPPEIAWTRSLKVEVPSPLYQNGHVYLVQDLGILLCYDGRTGDRRWRRRLHGNVSASPVFVNDMLLIAREEGQVMLIASGEENRLIAQNSIDDQIYATPVINGDRLLIRGLHHLYCIGTADGHSIPPESATELSQ